MKRLGIIAAIIGALILSALFFVRFHPGVTLPRFPLVCGGEFRVVKICYGGEYAHHIGGAPKEILWLWDHLPKNVKRVMPGPNWGDSGEIPSGHTALSIYWGFIHPLTDKAELGPAGDVLMTEDSGKQTNLGWPVAFFADQAGEGYRQILVYEPPTNSRHLRFRVPVEDEAVEFTINNPAYGR